MTVTALITEYNPFHNGHLYHMTEARRLTGADRLIVVMSGDFVQRGAPAILDKFDRAEMALRLGADLVLELPVFYACGSAQYFAEGAVSLLNGLNCVTDLCFGSECGDLAVLSRAAEFLVQEPPHYRASLKQALKEGEPFPKARQRALSSVLPEADGFLSSPNNILGLEYLKALQRTGSAIRPCTIKRIGDYHGRAAGGAFRSAASIRRLLTEDPPCFEELDVPREVQDILSSRYGHTFPILPSSFSAMLHYRLLTVSSAKELAGCFDVPDDLARRIFAHRRKFTDLDGFAALIKTRNYTESAVRRALFHILLQLPQKPYPVSYARILGFREHSCDLLHQIKKQGRLPLLAKPADAPAVFSSFYPSRAQAEEALRLLALDIRSSELYGSAVTAAYGTPVPAECSRQIAVLP